MAITLRELCDLKGCEDLALVAGDRGLDRRVEWVATLEDTDLIQFSNEGDLNFVTGLKVGTEAEILDLIKIAYEYKMAGIVFAPNHTYVKSLPQTAIEFGNDHDFPIFTIHWETKICDLTKVIGKFIADSELPRRVPMEVLQAILLGKEPVPFSRSVCDQMRLQGMLSVKKYRVVLFRIAKKGAYEEQDFTDFYNTLFHETVTLCELSGLVVPMSMSIAVVFTDDRAENASDKSSLENMVYIVKKLESRSDSFEIRLGIGSVVERLEEIRKSYNEAELVVNLLKNFYFEEKVYEYAKLGAYKVIWESQNQESAIAFSNNMLEPLITYDELNDTDLMECLKTYIECNSSIKETSDRLYLHKNTINYKLKKIESILGCCVSKNRDLFNLQYALMIREVFELK